MAPSTPATPVEMTAPIRPMKIDFCRPRIVRANMSWPRSFVPNQCELDGGE
jgi:hypothetical protein